MNIYKRLCPLLFLTAYIFSHTYVSAQEILKKFGDWEVICQSGDTKDKSLGASVEAKGETVKRHSCKMVQNHVVESAGKTVFLVSIVLGKTDQKPVAVISVPLGVYLAPGLAIKVDKKKPFRVLYEACNKSGCHAGFPLQNSIMRQFKRGNWAVATLMDTANEKVDVRVSLKGFTAAMAYLLESAKS